MLGAILGVGVDMPGGNTDILILTPRICILSLISAGQKVYQRVISAGDVALSVGIRLYYLIPGIQ